MKISKILFLILVVLASWSCSQEPVVFYVSPGGNDSNPGTSVDKPFATLQKARDAVRATKKNGTLKSPVTVYLLDGIYELSEPLILTDEDSGTEKCPVTYCAYQNEKPVISGGKKISGNWQKHEGEIMVCDVPEATDGKWKFRQLFINGTRMIRARIPDKDVNFSIEKTDKDLGRLSFKFRKGDIQNWNNLDEAEVILYHSWNESRLFISSIDEKERIVTFKGTRGFRLGQYMSDPNQYYVENVMEGLDSPGEWYLDSRAGKLYIYPTEDLSKAEIRAPVINQLVVLKGNLKEQKYVQYVNFSGLTFADVEYFLPDQGIAGLPDVGDLFQPSAITFNVTKFCKFENNVVRNTGSYALEVIGDGNKITKNEIYDTGSGGIITRSYGKEPNEITFNHIHDCGKEFVSGVGINVDDGGGQIAHNLIHNINQSGIYGRHWRRDTLPEQRLNQAQPLVIELNEIHDVMQRINDGAGIFIRDSNIIIRNNLIYNVHSPGNGTPGWGIYLGCETRYCQVLNNIVYNIKEGMHVWYSSRHNRIENNIFANSDVRQIYYQAPRERPLIDNHFVRNIVYNSKPDAAIFSVEGDHTLPAESDYNLIYQTGKDVTPVIRNSGGEKINSYATWVEHGYEKNSIVADPMFKDPANNDYTLLPGSPALKLGFKPIDMSTVGLRGTTE